MNEEHRERMEAMAAIGRVRGYLGHLPRESECRTIAALTDLSLDAVEFAHHRWMRRACAGVASDARTLPLTTHSSLRRAVVMLRAYRTAKRAGRFAC